MKLNEMIQACESLEETLEMAHGEALAIQKATKTENLDVMHIAQAREIVAMRIGYLQRQAEKAAEEKAAEEKAAAAVNQEPPK